jgi:hypothetical protein
VTLDFIVTVDFCCPMPEDPALLVGAAILTSPVFTKVILSIEPLCLGYGEWIALALWSSCAHMTGLAFVPYTPRFA